MGKLRIGLFLCLWCASVFADSIPIVYGTNADVQSTVQGLKWSELFPLDAPIPTVTNTMHRDRLRFTNDATGYWSITNLYPGNYRREFHGRFTVTTNWYEFPSTNGAVNADDPTYWRSATNGITQALTVAAGNTSYLPIPTNSATASDNQVASKTGDKTKWVTAVATNAGRTFYIATNGVTATAVMNDPSHPYALSNITVDPPLIATLAGDVIKVYQGNYFLSNNAPVRIAQGVTLEGVGFPVFHVDTNGNNGGRLDFSTFQAKDNSTIRGIVWEATNGWNTTTTLGAYASFLRSGPVYTNLLVENCALFGGSDVFYATNGGAFGTLTLRRNRITSYWDFNSGGSGVVISEGNTWTGLGDSSRPSRLVWTATKFYDSGSVFVGFAGYDLAASQGTFGLHGSVMEFSPVEGSSLWGSTRTDLTGDYVDDVQGKSYSLTAERSSYYTNSVTTNITYFLNPTNVYITDGNPDANVNGTYVLGATDNTFLTGQSFWTNQSHATYVLWLNDPAAFADEGAIAFSIRNNGGSMIVEGARGGWASFSITASNGFFSVPSGNIAQNQNADLADGPTTCVAAFGTNSIVTNTTPVLVPSIFSQAMIYATNVVWVGSGKAYGGNSQYLTNANATTLFGSGTVPAARLGSGSGGSSKFLREDSTFQTVAAGGGPSAYNSTQFSTNQTAGQLDFISGGGLTNIALAGAITQTNGWRIAQQSATDGLYPGIGFWTGAVGSPAASYIGSISAGDTPCVVFGINNSASNALTTGATISGGARNTNYGNSQLAVIAGGFSNIIGAISGGSGGERGNVIGGGLQNTISNGASLSVIVGGMNNLIGGANGIVSGMVLGGTNNQAGANFTLAAGRQAKAVNAGAFVWADSQQSDFPSAAPDTFNVRAQGGALFELGTSTFTNRGSMQITNSAVVGTNGPSHSTNVFQVASTDNRKAFEINQTVGKIFANVPTTFQAGVTNNSTLTNSGSADFGGAVSSFANNKSSTSVSNVTMGASPYSWTNNLGCNVFVIVDGGTAYSAKWLDTTVQSSLGGGVNLPLQPGEWCVVTYTVAPSFFVKKW